MTFNLNDLEDVCMCSLKVFFFVETILAHFFCLCRFFKNSLHFSDSRESERVTNGFSKVSVMYERISFLHFNFLEQQEALLYKM